MASMTADQWNACEDPLVLLELIEDRASVRKLYLFSCACFRSVWHLLPNEERNFVNSLEQTVIKEVQTSGFRYASKQQALWGARNAAIRAANLAEGVAEMYLAQGNHEVCLQADLVRDIFGNPSGQTFPISDWLEWNDGLISEIASTINCHNRFKEIPILADALEDSGCTFNEILSHLRNGLDHVPGCWVVDLLLGLK